LTRDTNLSVKVTSDHAATSEPAQCSANFIVVIDHQILAANSVTDARLITIITAMIMMKMMTTVHSFRQEKIRRKRKEEKEA